MRGEHQEPDTANMNTGKQNNILPIGFVTLAGSTLTFDARRKLVALDAERYFHTAIILEKHHEIGSFKLEALNVSVRLWEIIVYFRNGLTQTVDLPDEPTYENSESPFIDLKEFGGVSSITFILSAVRLNKKAPVMWIWGL
jgi:hypothetical protein